MIFQAERLARRGRLAIDDDAAHAECLEAGREHEAGRAGTDDKHIRFERVGRRGSGKPLLATAARRTASS